MISSIRLSFDLINNHNLRSHVFKVTFWVDTLSCMINIIYLRCELAHAQNVNISQTENWGSRYGCAKTQID